MGSHWHVYADWEALSESKRERLSVALHATDRDAEEVVVYADGMRGTWRSPFLSREELALFLARQHVVLTSALFFEPLKCDQPDGECDCRTVLSDWSSHPPRNWRPPGLVVRPRRLCKTATVVGPHASKAGRAGFRR